MRESGETSDGMGNRGVTRPMAGKKPNSSNDHHDHHQHGNDREKMLHLHHQNTLWIYWTILLLGVWLIFSPLTFDYGKNIVQPAGDRSLWLSDAERVLFMKWSDIISGILLFIFGWRSLRPDRPVSIWICCLIGVWLNFAPVIFWAPTAAAYMNSTFTGMLIIGLTILIPGMPNMIMYMKMGSEVPQGWTYNPSSWPQRWIMIVLGFMGWIVSRYIAAYQMGYIDNVWEPFFGNGSEKVLTSKMSHSIPISDGALGALAYTFEFLMGYMGSPSRWRTMPWMVAFFGILVIPLGLVHIFLVISQPLLVGTWCTMCLLAAAIMLPMIPLEADEVVAMGQHMVQAKRRGKKMWKTFWKGAEPVEENKDERTPELLNLPTNPGQVVKSAFWGMSIPWTLAISTIIGLMLMFAPNLFNVSIEKTAADINHLGGALIVVTSVISMGEVLRRCRYFNVLIGIVVATLPWFTDFSATGLNITSAIAGIAVIFLSFPRGPKLEKYGSWDKFVT